MVTIQTHTTSITYLFLILYYDIVKKMVKVSDYHPLSQYLKEQASEDNVEIALSIQEIENIIKRKLPATARTNTIGGQTPIKRNQDSVVLG